MPQTDVHAEIRAIRDELFRRHGGDLWALSRALVERSRAAGRVVVSFPPRPPQPPRVGSVPVGGQPGAMDAEAVA